MPGFQKTMMGSGLSSQAASAIAGLREMAKTATGADQAGAYAVTASFTEFTTTAASTGARLPATGGQVLIGDVIVIANQGASTLSVYPPVGFAIGLAAANAAVSITTGKAGMFIAKGDGNFYAILGA